MQSYESFDSQLIQEGGEEEPQTPTPGSGFNLGQEGEEEFGAGGGGKVVNGRNGIQSGDGYHGDEREEGEIGEEDEGERERERSGGGGGGGVRFEGVNGRDSGKAMAGPGMDGLDFRQDGIGNNSNGFHPHHPSNLDPGSDASDDDEHHSPSHSPTTIFRPTHTKSQSQSSRKSRPRKPATLLHSGETDIEESDMETESEFEDDDASQFRYPYDSETEANPDSDSGSDRTGRGGGARDEGGGDELGRDGRTRRMRFEDGDGMTTADEEEDDYSEVETTDDHSHLFSAGDMTQRFGGTSPLPGERPRSGLAGRAEDNKRRNGGGGGWNEGPAGGGSHLKPSNLSSTTQVYAPQFQSHNSLLPINGTPQSYPVPPPASIADDTTSSFEPDIEPESDLEGGFHYPTPSPSPSPPTSPNLPSPPDSPPPIHLRPPPGDSSGSTSTEGSVVNGLVGVTPKPNRTLKWDDRQGGEDEGEGEVDRSLAPSSLLLTPQGSQTSSTNDEDAVQRMLVPETPISKSLPPELMIDEEGEESEAEFHYPSDTDAESEDDGRESAIRVGNNEEIATETEEDTTGSWSFSGSATGLVAQNLGEPSAAAEEEEEVTRLHRDFGDEEDYGPTTLYPSGGPNLSLNRPEQVEMNPPPLPSSPPPPSPPPGSLPPSQSPTPSPPRSPSAYHHMGSSPKQGVMDLLPPLEIESELKESTPVPGSSSAELLQIEDDDDDGLDPDETLRDPDDEVHQTPIPISDNLRSSPSHSLSLSPTSPTDPSSNTDPPGPTEPEEGAALELDPDDIVPPTPLDPRPMPPSLPPSPSPPLSEVDEEESLPASPPPRRIINAPPETPKGNKRDGSGPNVTNGRPAALTLDTPRPRPQQTGLSNSVQAEREGNRVSGYSVSTNFSSKSHESANGSGKKEKEKNWWDNSSRSPSASIDGDGEEYYRLRGEIMSSSESDLHHETDGDEFEAGLEDDGDVFVYPGGGIGVVDSDEEVDELDREGYAKGLKEVLGEEGESLAGESEEVNSEVTTDGDDDTGQLAAVVARKEDGDTSSSVGAQASPGPSPNAGEHPTSSLDLDLEGDEDERGSVTTALPPPGMRTDSPNRRSLNGVPQLKSLSRLKGKGRDKGKGKEREEDEETEADVEEDATSEGMGGTRKGRNRRGSRVRPRIVVNGGSVNDDADRGTVIGGATRSGSSLPSPTVSAPSISVHAVSQASPSSPHSNPNPPSTSRPPPSPFANNNSPTQSPGIGKGLPELIQARKDKGKGKFRGTLPSGQVLHPSISRLRSSVSARDGLGLGLPTSGLGRKGNNYLQNRMSIASNESTLPTLGTPQRAISRYSSASNLNILVRNGSPLSAFKVGTASPRSDSVLEDDSRDLDGDRDSVNTSSTTLMSPALSNLGGGPSKPPPAAASQALQWASLRGISNRIYPSSVANKPQRQGARGMLDGVGEEGEYGRPTAIAASGMICVGTDRGWVMVFDYSQNLICVCGTETIATDCGPVTALSISHDHTFVAVGHGRGFIQLYALNKPNVPARSVSPIQLSPAVLQGRKEGHLVGSTILHVGFVGERHTAIVSADEQGLAFYHHLGKILGLASTDIIRLLGKYPDPAPKGPPPPPSFSSAGKSKPKAAADHLAHNLSPSSTSSTPTLVNPGLSNPRKPATTLDMAPLPLGPTPHPSEAYSFVAILGPTKLVIVGLKPSPRTWWRCGYSKPGIDPSSNHNQFATSGVIAWFPSIQKDSSKSESEEEKEKARSSKEAKGSKKGRKDESPEESTDPVLAFAWGKTLGFVTLSVDVEKLEQSKDTGEETKGEKGKLNKDKDKADRIIVDVGEESISFTERERKMFDHVILGLQWLNDRILLILTSAHIHIYDTKESQSLGKEPVRPDLIVSRDIYFDTFRRHRLGDSGGDAIFPPPKSYARSFRAYKGRIFLLTVTEVRAGTIMAWADRLLVLVQSGKVIEAIELATAYLCGLTDSSTLVFRDDAPLRRELVGRRLEEIMKASLVYIFSETRMMEMARRGSGADQTWEFESLVRCCVRACLAMDRTDFLFEDLWERYQESGIDAIYLTQLEHFVLSGDLRLIPPNITQGLIELHERKEELEEAERIIWHVDAECLDINQALGLCERQHLYDALIYVYSRAMGDFVGPIVVLLELIRSIEQHRKARPPRITTNSDSDESDFESDSSIVQEPEGVELLAPDAYKVYSYIGQSLSGNAYPSGMPLPEEEGIRARNVLYTFLFSGRTVTWPEAGGRPILTADEEGQPEPTFPYLRLLLQFDSEAMLDALDLAFEDSYLNDPMPGKSVHRQSIINVILDVMGPQSHGLSSLDRTFLHIFVARNVSKYPTFIDLPDKTLRKVLVGLASENDFNTREDRQLAAEYLLSSYRPKFDKDLLQMFEDAGFYRVLRSIYWRDRRWAALVKAYMEDSDVTIQELFESLGEAFRTSRRGPKKSSETQLQKAEMDTIVTRYGPQLSERNLHQTVVLVNRFMPFAHEEIVTLLDNSKRRQYAYLRALLQPDLADFDVKDEQYSSPPSIDAFGVEARLLYLSLMCDFDAGEVIPFLSKEPEELLTDKRVSAICQKRNAFDAVIWACDRRNDTQGGFEYLDDILEARTDLLIKAMRRSKVMASRSGRSSSASRMPPAFSGGVPPHVYVLQIFSLAQTATNICVRRCKPGEAAYDITVDDMWYRLLASLVEVVKRVEAVSPVDSTTDEGESSAVDSPRTATSPESTRSARQDLLRPQMANDECIPGTGQTQDAVAQLRKLIPDTLSTLISATPSGAVSFPRLMRRLLDTQTASFPLAPGVATSPQSTSPPASYPQFRSILTSMLDTYRFESDLLQLTTRLVGRDLFDQVAELNKQRRKGWRPSSSAMFGISSSGGNSGDVGGLCEGCGEALWGAHAPPGMTIAPPPVPALPPPSTTSMGTALGLGGMGATASASRVNTPGPSRRGSLAPLSAGGPMSSHPPTPRTVSASLPAGGHGLRRSSSLTSSFVDGGGGPSDYFQRAQAKAQEELIEKLASPKTPTGGRPLLAHRPSVKGKEPSWDWGDGAVGGGPMVPDEGAGYFPPGQADEEFDTINDAGGGGHNEGGVVGSSSSMVRSRSNRFGGMSSLGVASGRLAEEPEEELNSGNNLYGGDGDGEGVKGVLVKRDGTVWHHRCFLMSFSS